MNQESPQIVPVAAEKTELEEAHSLPDTHSSEQEPQVVMSADEIRKRMVTIRHRIDEESDEVIARVNALSDWRSYVRRYPWASVGAAAALGFILVPSRGKPDEEFSAPDTGKRSAAFTTDELRSVVIGAARKAATTYASRSLGSIVSSFLVTRDTE